MLEECRWQQLKGSEHATCYLRGLTRDMSIGRAATTSRTSDAARRGTSAMMRVWSKWTKPPRAAAMRTCYTTASAAQPPDWAPPVVGTHEPRSFWTARTHSGRTCDICMTTAAVKQPCANNREPRLGVCLRLKQTGWALCTHSGSLGLFLRGAYSPPTPAVSQGCKSSNCA